MKYTDVTVGTTHDLKDGEMKQVAANEAEPNRPTAIRSGKS